MKDIVTLEFAAHRRRLAIAREDGWVCVCGGWKGFKTAEYNKHLIDSLADAVATQLVERVERWSPDRYDANPDERYLAGFKGATQHLRDVANGCTCRPGMVGRWGCQVEGHDVSDGDLE